MPTDLPPDYKPNPLGGGNDAGAPGTLPLPGAGGTPDHSGPDVTDGTTGLPQPGPDAGAGLPGSPGGDVVAPGLPPTAPAI